MAPAAHSDWWRVRSRVICSFAWQMSAGAGRVYPDGLDSRKRQRQALMTREDKGLGVLGH